MRVGLVCPYDLAIPGGVQNQVLGLARALVEKGQQVRVVAPGAGRVEPGDLRIELLDTGQTTPVPANGSRAPIALGARAYRLTKDAIGAEDLDVVHIHEPFVPVVSLAARHAARKPVVATFHRAGAGRLYRALRPAARHMLGRIDRAVAVSDEARTTIEDVLGRHAPVEVLFNGVEPQRFFRAALNRHGDDDPLRIAFIGRLEDRKGLPVLLQAFSLLDARATLTIIGDGPQRQELAHLYRNESRIAFLGRVDDERLVDLLAECSIVVAPSLYGESFGVVLLEAMAAGALVVASDIPGYRIAAGDAALLVPTGDPFSLARAVEKLAGDQAMRDELRARGYARAEGFSFDALASAYLAIYRQLAARL
jgi:phosphatidylinositol alpha-mannosyltransferase